MHSLARLDCCASASGYLRIRRRNHVACDSRQRPYRHVACDGPRSGDPVSGALDAWRLRDGTWSSKTFWTGLAWQAAVAAGTPLQVREQSAWLARPGEPVRVEADLQPIERVPKELSASGSMTCEGRAGSGPVVARRPAKGFRGNCQAAGNSACKLVVTINGVHHEFPLAVQSEVRRGAVREGALEAAMQAQGAVVAEIGDLESRASRRVPTSAASHRNERVHMADALAVLADRLRSVPCERMVAAATGRFQLQIAQMQTRREIHSGSGVGRRRAQPCAISDLCAAGTGASVPQVKDPKYRNWSEDALREAQRLGCTYADIRFTFNRSNGIAVRNGRITTSGNIGFGQFGDEDTYGFGVRVIHSGVWGFASSPIVDARRDQAHRRHGHRRRQGQRDGQEVRREARAGQGLRHVLADADQGRSRGASRSRRRSTAAASMRPDRMQKNPDVLFATAAANFNYEWKFLATTRRLVHRAGVLLTAVQHDRDGAQGGSVKTRTYNPGTQTARLGVRHEKRPARATPSAWPPKRSSTPWPSRSAAG